MKNIFYVLLAPILALPAADVPVKQCQVQPQAAAVQPPAAAAATGQAVTLQNQITNQVQGTAKKYRVTIQNLSQGQPFSPPCLAFHTTDFRMFTVGEKSSPGMTLLAENGNNSLLVDQIKVKPNIFFVAGAADPIKPGESATFEMQMNVPDNARLQFSTASMLVMTNDGYSGVDGANLISLKSGEQQFVDTDVFDNGSEKNSELCSQIPGPACGKSANLRNPEENVVRLHPGVLGINKGKHLAKDDLTIRGDPIGDPEKFPTKVSRITIQLL